ncbi:hypothetical protein K432DRAFT_423398 [Lepidopterella palustris CBS 459.81]|uniref:DUF7514 domain-containing protein n=1 Tax=Lepidopterella palustris CBS 459.81 TaxID=1314670 RepID=A0A8E2JIC2_9PEZI|nr:hypothetical protein K432DRAFT_423398 [Lepidopterella palustris CBS 459.81]
MTTEPGDAQSKKAFQYWGYLFKPDKCGVDLLDRLLTGLANFIITHFEPTDCTDITPSQLAAFYRAVGGDYDVLFMKTLPSSLAFIYKSLGCLHSLQPTATDDGYGSPTIPALKKKGFITWQTIQLLLGPEEHVPFLQNAVRDLDILDPATGSAFPKLLPKESFPEKPDSAMVQWYEEVSERLRREAEAEEEREREKERLKHNITKVHVEVDDPAVSSEASADGSMDERNGAAAYFKDPLYRNRRPNIVRRFSRNPGRADRQFVEDRSRDVANSVRHFWNPMNRRRSLPDRHAEDGGQKEDDLTPTTTEPRYPPHKRPHPRREDSFSSTDSDSDVPNHHHNGPTLRHRRSHEPPPSPREYFPPHLNQPRRYSTDNRKSEAPTYGPTKAPLFATHVAQIQANNYYDRRPTMPPRASYPRRDVRYTIKEASPRESEPPHIRESRESPRVREPYEYPGRSSRRHSGERERTRDRDRDSRDRDQDRSRDRDRDRDRQRVHRYVTPVDGVGGRRYPVEAPWH